jgi:hypothetical protein
VQLVADSCHNREELRWALSVVEGNRAANTIHGGASMAHAPLSLGFGSSKRWGGAPIRTSGQCACTLRLQTDLFPVLEHGTVSSSQACGYPTLFAAKVPGTSRSQHPMTLQVF